MNESVGKTNENAMGFDLIDKVAQETQLPNEAIVNFLVNIIKAKNLDPKTLSLDELRESIINYIDSLN